MPKPILTKELAYEKIQKFFSGRIFVLFATGTSCAVDTCFGMGALADYLENKVQVELSREQKRKWSAVYDDYRISSDFENAMNSIDDPALIEIIVRNTGIFIDDINRKNIISIYNGEKEWPAIHIIKRLYETEKILHIATPNYDLLAEAAFGFHNIPYSTGFHGGLFRTFDWSVSTKHFCHYVKTKRVVTKKVDSHICLYKVHGSLNTYLHKGRIIETNIPASHLNGNEFSRLMITPGVSKFQRLHDHRTTLLGAFDGQVAHHTRFLFLGFGFNDSQLVNSQLKNKLKDESCFGVIITKDTNDRIEGLLSACDNLWLICEDKKSQGTRIVNRSYQELIVSSEKLWKFDDFARIIMGGK